MHFFFPAEAKERLVLGSAHPTVWKEMLMQLVGFVTEWNDLIGRKCFIFIL